MLVYKISRALLQKKRQNYWFRGILCRKLFKIMLKSMFAWKLSSQSYDAFNAFLFRQNWHTSCIFISFVKKKKVVEQKKNKRKKTRPNINCKYNLDDKISWKSRTKYELSSWIYLFSKSMKSIYVCRVRENAKFWLWFRNCSGIFHGKCFNTKNDSINPICSSFRPKFTFNISWQAG